MKIAQLWWTDNSGWQGDLSASLRDCAQLILLFGSRRLLEEGNAYSALKDMYPGAMVAGCSSAGEICGTRVLDDTLVATAIALDHTAVRLAQSKVDNECDSSEAGTALAQELNKPGLANILLFSDGLHVNGSELANGMRKHLPAGVMVTGGLAGDGKLFQRTLVVADGLPEEKVVAAIGFYGNRLKVGCGSKGGWDPFGPERLITRSRGNVLFELDGQSALSLYKAYLGEHAAGLPATALLFPLEIRSGESGQRVVRTVLSVDESDESMIFAGDLPEGAYARLMKANFDRLIGGAADAAQSGMEALGENSPDLALLISCVGRKLLLKQRTEEEVERTREVLGVQTVISGFYSYGEICASAPGAVCDLHNQTMTITTFREE